MFGDGYEEKKAIRLKEKENASEWVLEVPHPIRDSGIVDSFKTLDAGQAKHNELAAEKELGACS